MAISTMPDPPVDVKLKYDDGTLIPVECRYIGRQDGIACWEVVTDIDQERIKGVTIGQLPAKTSVALPIGTTEDDDV